MKSTTKSILFRADGSPELGMGHVMRCVALAEFFKEDDWSVSVSARGPVDGPAISVFRMNGYEPLVLDERIDLDSEAGALLDYIERHDVSVVVLDVSHRSNLAVPVAYAQYVRRLSCGGCTTVLIDGMESDCISTLVPVDANIVVVPYAGAHALVYKNEKARYLLGAGFSIFQKEFVKKHRLGREIRKTVDKILISMGGSDQSGLTHQSASALCRLPECTAQLIVLEGPGFTDEHKRLTREILQSYNGSISYRSGQASLAEQLIEADLAVVNDGLTKYEAAVTGTPSIVVSLDEKQRLLSEKFVELGACVQVGPVKDIAELSDTIDRVMKDHALRVSMSAAALASLDVRGGKKIVDEVTKEIGSAAKTKTAGPLRNR